MSDTLKGALRIVALLTALYVATLIHTALGLLLFLCAFLLAAISIIRPIPSLGLPTRRFGVAVLLSVMVGGTGTIGGIEESRLADLRAADPNAYLAELEKRSDQTRFLDELKVLAPERYAAEKEKIDAAATAKAQQKKEEADREQKRIEREKQVAQEETEEKRRYGFHCLSEWDGAHRAFKEAVKSTLRALDSFEHVETSTFPASAGRNKIVMTYRAQNGFGGMNVERAIGSFDNTTCDVRLEMIE